MFMHLNYARYVFIEFIFPFRLYDTDSEFDREDYMNVQLGVGVWHNGNFMFCLDEIYNNSNALPIFGPYGTWNNWPIQGYQYYVPTGLELIYLFCATVFCPYWTGYLYHYFPTNI